MAYLLGVFPISNDPDDNYPRVVRPSVVEDGNGNAVITYQVIRTNESEELIFKHSRTISRRIENSTRLDPLTGEEIERVKTGKYKDEYIGGRDSDGNIVDVGIGEHDYYAQAIANYPLPVLFAAGIQAIDEWGGFEIEDE